MNSPLKEILKELGIKKKDLALAADLSNGVLRNVEAGITGINDRLSSFLEEAGVDIESLKRKQEEYMAYVRHQKREEVLKKIKEDKEYTSQEKGKE